MTQQNHASQAVSSSFDLHTAMENLQEYFRSQNWPTVEMRIGINSGIMSVGNMGTKHRITYTVIGDAVNIASRIEQLTRTYHVKTIVSEYTKNAAEKYLYRLIDRVQIRGRSEPVYIYEPLAIKSESPDHLVECTEKNNAAVMAYLGGDIDYALNLFNELQNEQPADAYTKHMIQSIKNYNNRHN